MTDQITLSQFYKADGVKDWRLTSEGATGDSKHAQAVCEKLH